MVPVESPRKMKAIWLMVEYATILFRSVSLRAAPA